MLEITLLYLFLSIGMFAISLLFKVAGKLQLGIPLLYLLIAVISTFFTDWATKHETLVLAGLFVLIALSVLSWVLSLVKVIRRRRQEKALERSVAWQLQKAHEMGIPVERICVNEQGIVMDAQTSEPILAGEPVSYPDQTQE